MILEKIYSNDINRDVNPAVSADDLNDKTIKTEINEYVFTDDIIKGLYNVMNAIRLRNVSHNGIWINGYFGSGKSHFLKYLSYCLDAKYAETALNRFVAAVVERDPNFVNDATHGVDVAEAKDLAIWLKNATVDIILFNIGAVHNEHGSQQRVFLDVFWNEFNAHRGYNKFNLALAQYFEKVLDDKGKFEAFKQRLEEEGFDWKRDASTLAITELDMILEIGQELVPTLSIDRIRERVEKGNIDLSVETFTAELAEYIKNKGEQYRLVLLADEISQFIDNRKGLLLQLQEISTHLQQDCEGKVWVACTAQQDLSQIVQGCHIAETTDDYGKIMGRFNTKVSLKGTKPEYITQKRILDKNEEGVMLLGKLYESKRTAITAQFNLPTGYRSFDSDQEFIDYYPFVPYQFTLMKNVFDSFVNLGYVEKQVAGNERSIIKVTHSTARDTKNQELGELISFDQFFNAMFEDSLTHSANRAIMNANRVVPNFTGNREFAQRVVNVLFMICNMSEQDKAAFSPSIDNITCLLMRDLDCNKLSLKNDIRAVIDYLYEENIIRKELAKDGTTEIYSFYTEDEIDVANLIKAQRPNQDVMAKELEDLFKKYLVPNGRESYISANVSVGASVLGKLFLNNNADIMVDFVLEADEAASPAAYAMTNANNRMAFYMADAYKGKQTLRNHLYWYCQVKKYLSENQPQSDKRSQTHNAFRAQAQEIYERHIVPEFRELFDTSTLICGSHVIDTASRKKGKERYQEAMLTHLQNIYTYASLVASFPSTSDELKRKILRAIDPNEYKLLPLGEAEKQVDNFLKFQGHAVVVKDLVVKYSKAPYGWSEYATIFIVNELVRRHIYDFSYNNNPDVDRSVVASNILNNKDKFTVIPARAISQDLVNRMVTVWNDIFGMSSITTSMDSTEIVKSTKEQLEQLINNCNGELSKIGHYPFAATLREVINVAGEWKAIRDTEKYFERIITAHAEAKTLMDKRKEVRAFIDDQLARYEGMCQFVKNNSDNWEFLPEDCQEAITELKGILSDEWPIDSIPMYNRCMRMLNAKLDETRKQLKEEIGQAYRTTDEELQSIAADMQVPYLRTIDAVIMQRTNSQNIATLKMNLNTDEYYAGEVKKIQAEANAKADTTPKNPSAPSSTPAAKPRIKQVTLRTRSTGTLKSASDVERYLDALRSQLMKNIDEGNEIIVI